MITIKTKLFVFFAIFMIGLVFCGILFNVLFLERYYIYKNKSFFINTSNRITEEYIKNRENIDSYINQIDRAEGISCTITDRERNAKINSVPGKPEQDSMRLPGEIEQLISENQDKLTKTYVYKVIKKPNEGVPILAFVSKVDSGDFIILRKPMKGIDESVAIANQFYLFAGFLMVLIGGIIIFLISKRVTKPITEMSLVAQDISNMDFTKKVRIKTQDEIGSLGRSINLISDKLSSSINELREDVGRRKLLVRNLSHELKTPIGVIKGYAEGLKFGVANDMEKQNRYCSVIAEECDRMDGMIRELLDLSMLENGMFKLNISQFDLYELINNVADKFSHIINEKAIQLDIIYETDISVFADNELIERALINFLTNAINYTTGRKIIQIKIQRVSGRTRISVFNSGSHVPESDMENIWDVFYKADKARSRQYGGHGLGLSIVKLIAQAHGGSYGAENMPDGVCFYIDIMDQKN